MEVHGVRDEGQRCQCRKISPGKQFSRLHAFLEERSLLGEHPYFKQSMGELLVELANEIPPVVVDPRRPQAIFLMQENYFGSVMFGALSPQEAISQYREAMKQPWGKR